MFVFFTDFYILCILRLNICGYVIFDFLDFEFELAEEHVLNEAEIFAGWESMAQRWCPPRGAAVRRGRRPWAQCMARAARQHW